MKDLIDIIVGIIILISYLFESIFKVVVSILAVPVAILIGIFRPVLDRFLRSHRQVIDKIDDYVFHFKSKSYVITRWIYRKYRTY
jgi:hypothetical protein